VNKARAAFPQLPIRLGLEMDYLAGQEAWWEGIENVGALGFLDRQRALSAGRLGGG